MNGDAPSSAVMSVRKLSHSDLPALLSLCLGNPQYYSFLDEEPTMDALAAEMTELPPGCSLDQKFYLGFFDAGGIFSPCSTSFGDIQLRGAPSSGSSWSTPLGRGQVLGACSSRSFWTASAARAFLACASPTSRGTSSHATSGGSAVSLRLAHRLTKENTKSSPWSVRLHRPFLLRRTASDYDKLKN